MNNFIEINNLKKKFNLLNNNELLIFENLNFSITKNSITSIVGSSGCGKSTLLNILGLLDSNFEGKFLVGFLLFEVKVLGSFPRVVILVFRYGVVSSMVSG